MSLSQRPLIDLDGPHALRWGYRRVPPVSDNGVGEWVREQRRARGWRQHHLAGLVDSAGGLPVTPDDINAVEWGWHRPEPDVWERLVGVFAAWPLPGRKVVRGVARVR